MLRAPMASLLLLCDARSSVRPSCPAPPCHPAGYRNFAQIRGGALCLRLPVAMCLPHRGSLSQRDPLLPPPPLLLPPLLVRAGRNVHAVPTPGPCLPQTPTWRRCAALCCAVRSPLTCLLWSPMLTWRRPRPGGAARRRAVRQPDEPLRAARARQEGRILGRPLLSAGALLSGSALSSAGAACFPAALSAGCLRARLGPSEEERSAHGPSPRT